jgi:ubiquinone/menaquinone biosynthesis C-methylase UbiE
MVTATGLKKLQRNWEGLARKDPLWAILADPSKKGGRWDVEEFFNTGQREIDDLMKHIDSLHVNMARDSAMDFGCGVGRVSQALAHYFNCVCGVDIAPTMIELARKYNRYPEKCKFYLNETDDLKAFEDSSFHLVYSNITLQHMEKKCIMRYLREFLRVIASGGLIVFQLPSSPSFRTWLFGQIYWRIPFYYSIRYGGKMETHWVKKSEILELVRISGGRVLETVQVESTSGRQEWQNYKYYITKQ